MRTVALQARRNAGKTTSISLADYGLMGLKEFEGTYFTAPATAGSREAPARILLINGHLIGIAPDGDDEATVTRQMNYLIEARCTINLCACRTSGGTPWAIRRLGGDVRFIRKNPNLPQERWQHSNREAAAELVREVCQAIRVRGPHTLTETHSTLDRRGYEGGTRVGV